MDHEHELIEHKCQCSPFFQNASSWQSAYTICTICNIYTIYTIYIYIYLYDLYYLYYLYYLYNIYSILSILSTPTLSTLKTLSTLYTLSILYIYIHILCQHCPRHDLVSRVDQQLGAELGIACDKNPLRGRPWTVYS